jgi:hypothetical protein
MTEKSTPYRQRRAAATARWRKRRRGGQAMYPLVIDRATVELATRLGELRADKMQDRQAVAAAMERLLHRALAALVRERTCH